MPTSPPSVCSKCGTAVRGACPKCTTPWERKPESWAGGGTRRWRRFRAAWLADYPLCEGWPHGAPCGRVADTVDHIRNLGTYPPGPEREFARYDPENVQSLCRDHHKAKTHSESVHARRRSTAQRRGEPVPPPALW
jgi:5-methylcytosine-specific restriction protein A